MHVTNITPIEYLLNCRESYEKGSKCVHGQRHQKPTRRLAALSNQARPHSHVNITLTSLPNIKCLDVMCSFCGAQGHWHCPGSSAAFSGYTS
jgi:hypothetical protein